MIRLLVVDDSPLMRRLLASLFEAEGDFLMAQARDGVEALALLHDFSPDVVTLDVQMPQLDGLACLERIMLERPCPVVMLSALTASGAEATLEALRQGAVDVVPKPGGAVSLAMETLGPELVRKVRAAARARPSGAHRLAERVRLRAQAA
ncbi:response regulator, partial [Teichococcus aestuarii]